MKFFLLLALNVFAFGVLAFQFSRYSELAGRPADVLSDASFKEEAARIKNRIGELNPDVKFPASEPDADREIKLEFRGELAEMEKVFAFIGAEAAVVSLKYTITSLDFYSSTPDLSFDVRLQL